MTEAGRKPGSTTQIHVGSLALEEGLITQSQLREALAERAREMAAGNKDCTLGDVLIQMGLLDPKQVERFVREPGRSEGGEPEKPGAAEPKSRETRFLVEGNFGKYRILRQLGHGGMGVVYEALDPVLNRRVALKLLRKREEFTQQDAERDEERFLREAQLAATLDRHPHIVGVYEAGMVRDRPYIAMELVEGRPMNEWLKSSGPSLRARVAMLRDVAHAVEVAHRRGIIHRDLSPKNILVDEDHRPHVTDFGLAKAIGGEGSLSLTDPQMSVGTPNYMSPEQAQGLKNVDRRTDVYSLGVMLYEILAGRTPFEGDTTVQILVQVVRDPIQAPSKIREALEQSGDVNPELERICLKAVGKDPDKRYPSAGEFGKELDAWLSDAGMPRRSSRGVAVALMILVLAAIGAAVWMSPRRGAPPTSAPGPAATSPAPVQNAVELVAGDAIREDGLGIVSGREAPTQSVLHAGKPCLRMTAAGDGFRRLRLDVDDAWAAGVGTVEVEIEYYDGKERETGIMVRFDSTEERNKSTGGILLMGQEKWKTRVVRLANPMFENRLDNVCDLRLSSGRSDFYIHRVAVRRYPAAGSSVAGPLSSVSMEEGSLKPGLVGEYFEGEDFDTAVKRRIDSEIDFDWGDQGPAGLVDHFSARWSGFVRAPRPGLYIFEVRSNNGARLRVGGETILEQWKSYTSIAGVGACRLDAGLHRIELEYFERERAALIFLGIYASEPSGMVRLTADHFRHE